MFIALFVNSCHVPSHDYISLKNKPFFENLVPRSKCKFYMMIS